MHKNYTFAAPSEYYIEKLPELLFIQYDEDLKDQNRKVHAHDFWQLEFLLSGYMEIKSQNLKLEMANNDCVLIAPGIPHRIIYGKWNQSVWSVKFKIDIEKSPDKIILMERSAASLNVRNNIFQILNSLNTRYDSYIVLQYHLGMLLELEFQKNDIESGSAFISQIKMFIDSREGRPVSVNELADQLKCSRNTVSKRFHDETGITLKSFIDSRRIETARKMLLYSNQKIIDIASITGFADVYSFSRFFRRIQGCSPRQYRMQNKK